MRTIGRHLAKSSPMEGTTPAPEPRDLDLFRTLNEQYRNRPLVPEPPKQTPKSFETVAEGRIRVISRHLPDLVGCDVLEVGTGRGYTAALLPAQAGAKHVTGIDIRRYPEWDLHDPDATTFLKGDLAGGQFVDSDSMDAVISAVVMEHVTRPIRMLAEIHRVLRPGGQAWLYFNLYRGPKASHRYRSIFFPWPHLLFDDAQSADFLAEREMGKFAWVNRMTAAEYVNVCVEIGFEITEVRRHVSDLEQYLDFYLRFADTLSRYPALDLETDFLTLVLTKLPEPGDRIPRLEYHRRQMRFDRIVRAHQIAQLEEQRAS